MGCIGLLESELTCQANCLSVCLTFSCRIQCCCRYLEAQRRFHSPAICWIQRNCRNGVLWWHREQSLPVLMTKSSLLEVDSPGNSIVLQLPSLWWVSDSCKAVSIKPRTDGSNWKFKVHHNISPLQLGTAFKCSPLLFCIFFPLPTS